jgi:ankyrin repeat protein
MEVAMNERLEQAIMQGDRATVEQLVEQNPALVNAVNAQGVPVFMLALYTNEPAIYDWLVQAGAQIDVFAAAATGNLARLKAELQVDPGRVNAFSADGFQPLGLACFFGQTATAEYLLDHGAEVNTPSRNPMRVAPLHSALASRNAELARLLVERGADVNAVQRDDYTPLHEAAQNGDQATAAYLLEHGANPRARLGGGQTPADVARAAGHADLADWLEGR